MKLFYWKGVNGFRNFGDELNNLIWPKLIPDILDDSNDSNFVGIGTLLNEHLPRSGKIAVFGSGVGYGQLPQGHDKWKIYCLRGPLSANALNVDPKLAIADPAILVDTMVVSSSEKKWQFGYMPHWLNANPILEQSCLDIRFAYINPLSDVKSVLETISGVECLITEAMHGAIVADTLRIPWIAIADSRNPHTCPFKWYDWCYSVKLHFKPVKSPVIYGEVFHSSATRNLIRISNHEYPILSKKGHVDGLRARLMEKLLKFKEDFKRDVFR